MMTVIDPAEHGAFFVWLASSLVPVETLLAVSESFPDIASFHASFMRKEDNAVALIPPRYHHTLYANGSQKQLEKYSQALTEYKIGFLSALDPVYPFRLLNIPDPPAVLFYQGELSCMEGRCLAIVGSRAASYAGQTATRKVAKNLSLHGVCAVSGMAYGIDTAAHRGCLDGGSPTVAVMGCGLDIIYPSGQTRLREEILNNGGLLISEFIPGERPLGWHFPMRNRVITGISDALVLMEAKIKSGSMTSVQHALNQGKEVFVYPGDPSTEYYEGNHQLLREGARFFTSAEDILEDMEWLDNQAIVRHNIDCSVWNLPESPAEQTILKALKPGSLSFEQLSQMTGLSPSELLSSITMLQVKGIVESLPGKLYRIKG